MASGVLSIFRGHCQPAGRTRRQVIDSNLSSLNLTNLTHLSHPILTYSILSYLHLLSLLYPVITVLDTPLPRNTNTLAAFCLLVKIGSKSTASGIRGSIMRSIISWCRSIMNLEVGWSNSRSYRNISFYILPILFQHILSKLPLNVL